LKKSAAIDTVVLMIVNDCVFQNTLLHAIPAHGGLYSRSAQIIFLDSWNKQSHGDVYDCVKQQTQKQKTWTPARKLAFVAFGLVCGTGFASILHPFGPVRNASSPEPLLAGASVPPAVLDTVTRACGNCHSEKTEWPLYSRFAPMSWMIEKDVHDARSHMNLSRWNSYDPDEQQQLLSQIGSAVRNRIMPLPRYLLLHPEARLSDLERDRLYQWTRSERRRVKSSEPPPAVALGSDSGSGASGASR
jgi:hypothetical protein